MSKFTQKLATVGLAIVTVVSLSGISAAPAQAALSSTQVDAIISLLTSFGADATTIANVRASLTGGTPTPTPTPNPSSYNFTRNLTIGSTGADVKALQQWLNANGYVVAASGAGSVGNETMTFGPATRTALAKYQVAAGISPAAGYFGAVTRAKIMAAGGSNNGGGTPTPVPAGTDLLVELASDSPAARTIGTGTAFNSALKVKLSAASKDVKITSLSFMKSGFVANTNLNGIDVVDSQGVRHGQVVTSINADNTIMIGMTSDPIVVRAGTSETITVRFNLLSGDYTGTVSFSLPSVSAITADTSAISGAFPISGQAMNIVNGGNALGAVTVSVLTSTGSSTLNVDSASQQEITKFRLAETSSKEGVNLYKWVLYNYGNAASSDYSDVQLVAQDGTVLATAQPVGQYVTFNLATPYFIDKGLTKDFTVKAKIIGGTTKTIKLVTYNDYDLDVRGATTGVSIIPTATGNDTTFPVGNAWNQTTIGSGTITLQRASDSPSSAVTPGSTSAVLAKFIAKPTGENYELRQVKFYITTSSSASATALTGTVYVKVNGSIVYSTAASNISKTSQSTISLSSYPILTAGQDAVITIEASISSAALNTDAYQVKSFDLTGAKRLVSNDLLSDGDSGLNTAAVDGLQISVQSAKLAVTTLATPVVNSVVAGTSQYELAQIQLNAQSGGEDVKVSTIVVTDTLGSGTDYSGVSNLVMYKDNDTTPLTTSNSTAANANTVTFNFSTPIVVTKTTPVILHLKGDVVASTGTSHRFNVASSTTAISATGATTGNSLTHGTDVTYSGNGQVQTVAAAGSLTMSLVSGSGASPSTNQVVNAGTQGVTVFAFKLTSLYEAQKITSLKLTATSTSATSLALTTLQNIKLYEGNATTPFAQAPQFDACTSGECTVTFTASDNLLAAAVPTTGVTVYVKADVAPGGQAILGNDFKFMIASSTADVAVKGAVTGSTSGTKTGTPTATGVTYVVPQNVTVEAVSPTASVQLGTGAGQVVGVFKVTNNGTAPILLSTSTLSFANGGSATTSIGFTVYSSAVGGSQSDTSGWNSGNGYGATAGTTGASSTIAFATSTMTAAEQTISGGSWRYITVKTTGVAGNNNTVQLSVSSLGSLVYNVAEADLGYSGNSDSDLSDTITGLKVSGTPSLATVTLKD